MSQPIYTSNNYFFLLLLGVGVSMFPNFELTFFVWSFLILITLQRKYPTILVHYILIFSIIVVISLLSTSWSNVAVFPAIRDFTYLIKPILGLLLGYQLAIGNSKIVVLRLVTTGVCLAVLHLLMVAYGMVCNVNLSFHAIRAYAGYFNDFEIYVIIFLLFHKILPMDLSPKTRKAYLLILVISSLFYFSRTNIIQCVILVMAMLGLFRSTKTNLVYLFTVVAFISIAYAAIYEYNPRREAKGIEGFLYKIKIAPIEPFKTKIDPSDWKDFNDNYRSFENILTGREINKGGLKSILIGNGLGSYINLGQRVMNNDGEYMQRIPIVHNGFMTILLKSGISGVLLLVIFLLYLGNPLKSGTVHLQSINLMLVGTAVFLVISNWVFMGLYLKLDNKSIVIGYLIALQQILLKETNVRT